MADNVTENIQEQFEVNAPNMKMNNESGNQNNAGNFSFKEDECKIDNNPDIEICRNYCNNRCNRGIKCKFLHPKNIPSMPYERNRSRSPNSKNSDNRSSICRDFLRNTCARGKDCRYFHPPEGEYEKKSWFTLCLDFQNGRCSRHDCRYFHITPKDEQLFRDTGEVSLQILDQAMQKSISLDVPSQTSRPTCKDFLKGMCNLRNCKYEHVSRREYEDEVYKSLREELYKQIIGDGNGPPSDFGPPMHREGSFGMMPGGRNGNERGGLRMGPPPYDNFMERDGPPMGRGNFPPSQFAPFGMRSRPDFHDRPPSPPRDMRHNDTESLRRELSQLQNHMHQLRGEKDQEIMELKGQLNHLRDGGLYNSNQNSFEELREANENTLKLNRDLQMDLKMMHKRNEELLRDLKASNNWEQVYSEAKLKLQDTQIENRKYIEKLEVQNEKMSTMKSEIQAWERYESFVKEQVYKLQSQLLVVEGELSKSWGGGPPPMPSQREAWNYLKSVISYMLSPSSSTKEPEPSTYGNAAVSSYSSAQSYSSGLNSWNNNGSDLPYSGSGSYAPMYNASSQNSQSRGGMEHGSAW